MLHLAWPSPTPASLLDPPEQNPLFLNTLFTASGAVSMAVCEGDPVPTPLCAPSSRSQGSKQDVRLVLPASQCHAGTLTPFLPTHLPLRLSSDHMVGSVLSAAQPDG